MKKCPSCAESIQDEAKKCRFCGTDLTRPTNPKDAKAKNHPKYGTYTLICVLIPLAGIIIGIIAMTKSDPLEKKLGEHALAVSITLSVVYAIFFPLLMGVLAGR